MAGHRKTGTVGAAAALEGKAPEGWNMGAGAGTEGDEVVGAGVLEGTTWIEGLLVFICKQRSRL